MNTQIQKPNKKDFKQMLWIILAGAALGFVMNMLSDNGIRLMKALGL